MIRKRVGIILDRVIPASIREEITRIDGPPKFLKLANPEFIEVSSFYAGLSSGNGGSSALPSPYFCGCFIFEPAPGFAYIFEPGGFQGPR
jgi:hypothetical protein